MKHVLVRPVLYMSVERIPPANTRAGDLIVDVQRYAKERQYLEAPSAWFVPIADLRTRIEAVVDYLQFDTISQNGFEIGGGFEIVSQDGSLGLPAGASFICAMQLAEAIIDMKENESKEACIDNDRFILLSCQSGMISMEIGHRARYIPPKRLVVPADDLKKEMKIACKELIQFAEELEPLLIQFDDFHISSEHVKFMFGLEKQDSTKGNSA